jgi:hypothetical protein
VRSRAFKDDRTARLPLKGFRQAATGPHFGLTLHEGPARQLAPAAVPGRQRPSFIMSVSNSGRTPPCRVHRLSAAAEQGRPGAHRRQERSPIRTGPEENPRRSSGRPSGRPDSDQAGFGPADGSDGRPDGAPLSNMPRRWPGGLCPGNQRDNPTDTEGRVQEPTSDGATVRVIRRARIGVWEIPRFSLADWVSAEGARCQRLG